MKKKMGKFLVLAAAVAAGALMLTGCSALYKSNTGSGTANVSDAAGTQSGGSTAEGTSGAADTAGTSVTDDSQVSADTVQQAPAADEPVGEVIPDEYADAAEAENRAEEIWTGTYVSDSERVTVSQNDDVISFSFAQSGISGTAQVDGSQAVFNGDDYHVVVFSLNDTVLNVAVSSEEDFDASSSPLNGTYIRSAD